MRSSASASLKQSNLPETVRKAHLYPDLAYKSLLSAGQFCDAGYAAVFLKDRVEIVKKENVSIKGPPHIVGQRNEATDGLWITDINNNSLVPTRDTNTTVNSANSVYNLRTIADVIKYHHMCSWCPCIKTWTEAIDNGHFSGFPGLTSANVRKYLPQSIETTKGHMTKERQHKRSTKNPAEIVTSHHKQQDQRPSQKNEAVFQTFPVETGKIASDLTGRFPIRSSKGNQYVMVAYIHDPNVILAIPIKDRTQTSLVTAYTDLYNQIKHKGFTPHLHICDNECPEAFKKFLTFKNVTLQKVPPYDHRTNPAEKAIDTFKSHFISGLASLHPEFPLHLWDRLIPHAELTLNLLRKSNQHQHLSAYAHWNGMFDYNAHPLAPPGCKTVVHETREQRHTWDEKGALAWYLGPAMDHYRCHEVYLTKSRAERVAKSVKFFPHNCPAPQADPKDNAARAAIALTEALQQSQRGTDFTDPSQAQMKALLELSNIFTSLITPKPANDLKPVSTGSKTTFNCDMKNSPVQQPRVWDQQPKQTDPSSKTVIQPRVSQNKPQDTLPQPNIVVTQPRVPEPQQPDVIPYNEDELSRTTHPYNLRKRPQACAVLNADTGKLEEYGALMKGPFKSLWERAYANDLGRLAQGVHGRIQGTNTVFFISHTEVPPNKKVTYGKKEVSIRPNKTETHRVRLTVGGDKLHFDGDTATQCASIVTAKILINSVISTEGARYSVIDIKNMYYGSPMDEYEYMKIRYDEIPEEIKVQYNLGTLEHKGYVYIQIRKGMPGLKQAGKIANTRLTKHLQQYGYHPTPRTPSLWVHRDRPVSFTLVVDDFGVKYTKLADFQHLCDALRDLYEITVDMSGSKYLGMTIDWDYTKKTVDISMPGYLPKALHRFQHIPTKVRRSPHQAPRIIYGQKQQLVQIEPEEAPQSKTAQKYVQQVVGTLLYYALTIDLTMLVALGSIAAQQNNPTQKTMSEITWLLDYCAANPDAKIRYNASDMVLWISSDASYLSEPNAKSRAGGLFFLSDKVLSHNQPMQKPRSNGIIACLAKTIKNIMSSAMEAEVAAAYENAREACPIRVTLEELGHPQPATPMQVDNSAAIGFVNGTMKHKRSKAIDMRFHWIADRVRQGQFYVYWAPGSENWADYVTKHHPPSHHQLMRPKFFQSHHQANTIFSNVLSRV